MCPKRQTENREGRRLCSKCGSPLRTLRPSRRAVNEPGENHRGECGHSLADLASHPAIPPSSPTPAFARPLTARAGGWRQVKRLLGESGEEKASRAHDARLDREVARARIRRERRPCPVLSTLPGRDVEGIVKNLDEESRIGMKILLHH